VQVLGTSFGVRQYAGEPMTRVVVDDGRVLVKTRVHSSVPASPAVLASRMVAQVSDSIITVTSGITTREYTSWTQGVLVFNNVPLHNVVGELARAYGVDIRIADTVLAKQIIGIEISVTKHSINQVLGSMCHVTNAHYSYDGQSYVISPGRVATKSPRVAPSRYSFPQPEQQYGR
jgi:ferric-dicitrate binding protein FerR (iron transport regulator)